MMAIGKAHTVLYSVVYTERSAIIRIISARRSTAKERSFYEQAKQR